VVISTTYNYSGIFIDLEKGSIQMDSFSLYDNDCYKETGATY